MAATQPGPNGHLVLKHVELGENLDHVHVRILSQCMEEMTAQTWVRVLILQVVWTCIAQVILSKHFVFPAVSE